MITEKIKQSNWYRLLSDFVDKYRLWGVGVVGFCILLFKTVIFSALISVYSGAFQLDYMLIAAQLMMILIIIVPFLYLKGKGKLRYLIFVDFIYSVLLVIDLIYFRETETFLGIRNIFFTGLLANGFKFSVKDLLNIIFFIDIPVLLLWSRKDIGIRKCKRFFVLPSVIIMLGSIIIYGTHYLVDIKKINNGESTFIKTEWSPFVTMRNMSPIGYHAYEAINTMKMVMKDSSEEDLEKVDSWLAWNKENLPDNEYKAISKGKNVIFIQFESLEQFVINQKVDGQEITPNINRLINEGVYFPNIYEQNNKGNSADCDFMANSSVLPLGDNITFLTNSEVKYPSLSRLLKDDGYTTITSHAEGKGSYNWGENYNYSFGIDNIWDISKFSITEKVGGYNSDRQYLEQSAKKLDEIKRPFYALLATASSHGPFYMEDEYKYLNLSKELNENRLGEYFQSIHYSDKQLGMFIDELEKSGLLNDTLIVLYGDHGGVHKYYSQMIENAPLEDEFWKEDNMKVPLVMYSKGIKPKVVEASGGQIDIVPTTLYLLGKDCNNLMGRNLLNTNRDATVMTDRDKNHVIKGIPKSDEELRRLEEAYDIGDIIIKERYYEQRKLVN